MIEIKDANAEDFPAIRDVAYKTWPDTYGKILSEKQINYMLDSFYSEETLRKNASEKGHAFLLLKDDGIPLGFASYEHHYHGENATRLHKLYLLPESQGKGAGKLLMDAVTAKAIENGSDFISLNVNRFNNARHFYLKNGFVIVGEEDLEIGLGYLMEDFKMEKPLSLQKSHA